MCHCSRLRALLLQCLQERLIARAGQVQQFQQQLQALSAAADGLQQHITSHSDQVGGVGSTTSEPLHEPAGG